MMILDLIFILVLTYMMIKATGGFGYRVFEQIGNVGGCFVATVLLYGVFKAPIILIFGGFTWPVNPDPLLHLISGGCSFLFVSYVLMLAYRKKYGLNHTKWW